MNGVIHGRRWLTALLIAISALTIGAVFGPRATPGGERRQAFEHRTADHLRLGQGGPTLTATNGTWDGTAPRHVRVRLEPLRQGRRELLRITGATANTYVLKTSTPARRCGSR